jgi:hypothetical protein
MEPQLPKPQLTPEMPQSNALPQTGGEAFRVPVSPESAVAPIEAGKETKEVLHDEPKGDPAGAPAGFTPPPMPVIDPVVTQGATSNNSADDTNPVAAADEDLIEKEWVEKAKRVVKETHNDPHAQDMAIGRLQADYLKKRYGKIIALPKEG